MSEHAGFVYAGRTRDGSVIKIGMTMQNDPASYVKRRYAGLLTLEALCLVSDAREVEARLHKHFEAYRMQGDGRELFRGCIQSHEIQDAIQKACTDIHGMVQRKKKVKVDNSRDIFYEDD